MKNRSQCIFKYHLVLICLLTTSKLFAQQQAMFTQYMFNALAINPAYAGSHKTVSATLLARDQWTGFEGAPKTQTLAVHSPFIKDNIGLGGMIIHDKIGVTNQLGLNISYAYTLNFNNGSKLAFGLQTVFNNYNIDFNALDVKDVNFNKANINLTQFNFGAGLYYYGERFYVGFAVPHAMNRDFDVGNNDSDAQLVRHFFFHSGYVFDLNTSLKLKPNILVKAVQGAPVEIDLNANLIIKDLFWVGLSWRSFASTDVLLRYQISNRFQVGYAYDFPTTKEVRRINAGSHELMLSFLIPNSKYKFVTPRYF